MADTQLQNVAEKKVWLQKVQCLQTAAVGESLDFLSPEFQLKPGRLACVADSAETLLELVKHWDKKCELKWEKTKLVNMKTHEV